jgi:hypothetical protein
VATSKVAVIAFPAQTSIAPPIVSAERACRCAESSPPVRRLGATPKGLRPSFLTQGKAGSQQKEPLPRPLVGAGSEQSQPVITSILIRVHPQSSTQEALMTRSKRKKSATAFRPGASKTREALLYEFTLNCRNARGRGSLLKSNWRTRC